MCLKHLKTNWESILTRYFVYFPQKNPEQSRKTFINFFLRMNLTFLTTCMQIQIISKDEISSLTCVRTRIFISIALSKLEGWDADRNCRCTLKKDGNFLPHANVPTPLCHRIWWKVFHSSPGGKLNYWEGIKGKCLWM